MEFAHSEHDMTSRETSCHAPEEESEDLSQPQDWFERNSLFPCDDDSENDSEDEALDLPSRRLSRAIAFQVLSEIDVTGHDKSVVFSWIIESNQVDRSSALFAEELIEHVDSNKADLDIIIEQHATAWPLNQVSVVDRNVLRIAFYEIVFENETSFQIIVNEAVELAKLFGGDNSPKFVNGVLGALVDNKILEKLT
ncbi:MAG: transcription antitermination factor NusB [Chloroflexi bacterium]|nr:transcription antitermination factor NusB [Chloroflexota bacterium]